MSSSPHQDTTTVQPTPAQAIALRALARSPATASHTAGLWFAYNERGLQVQISAVTARVLEMDGLVRREGKPVKLVLTEAGRAWERANT